MEKKLLAIADRAEKLAGLAREAAADTSVDHGKLHLAMMDLRAATVAYLAHPSVSAYVRLDAQRYSGQAREAVDRIADLIDQLNEDR